MRLSRPLFTQPGLFHPEPCDLGNAIKSRGADNFILQENQILDTTFSPEFGLLLPQSFGLEKGCLKKNYFIHFWLSELYTWVKLFKVIFVFRMWALVWFQMYQLRFVQEGCIS